MPYCDSDSDSDSDSGAILGDGVARIFAGVHPCHKRSFTFGFGVLELVGLGTGPAPSQKRTRLIVVHF